jgi:putative tributyrin esterase
MLKYQECCERLRALPLKAMECVNFHSPALLKACSMTVIVPECSVGTPPFPVCYLLHGLSDDHTSWARHTSIERHVAGLPLIVVMPDGGRGFYCDAVEGRPTSATSSKT